jgi:hypothetical protein
MGITLRLKNKESIIISGPKITICSVEMYPEVKITKDSN